MVLNNYAYFLSLVKRADLEKALTVASRATALTDNNPTYLDTHARVLFKLGRVDEAEENQQQAIALDAQESLALLVHYGDIPQKAMGENFMAEVYWRKALERLRRRADRAPDNGKQINKKSNPKNAMEADEELHTDLSCCSLVRYGRRTGRPQNRGTEAQG